ncbi:MAG: esterase/lipase family protein [Candidatus Binataceae bacterium]
MTTGAVLKEIAAAGALLASYPLDRIARIAPAIMCAAPAEPVILIHGYGGGRSNLLALASYLRLAGMDNISYFEYPRRQPLTASAMKLGAMVDEVAGPTGGAHLVGHSLGGSIARLYSITARRGAVRSLVTLGSPYLFGHWAQRELAIFGDEDPIVLAPTGLIAQSMPFGRRVVLEGTGHLALAFLPEAMRLVATELRANRAAN